MKGLSDRGSTPLRSIPKNLVKSRDFAGFFVFWGLPSGNFLVDLFIKIGHNRGRKYAS